MENFITQLFTAFGFVTTETQEPSRFFTRADAYRSEYYLVLFIKKTDLPAMETKLEEVNALFETKKTAATDIEKNTSLVICVEFDSYREDCIRFKNRLHQIEEDEFFYRKYVVPYTLTALSGLNAQEDVVASIHQTITDEDKFEAFNTNMFADELYFFAMQLFIKLPFLKLNVTRSNDFMPISALLSQRIAASEQQFLHNVLQVPQLEQNQRDQLLQKAMDPNDSSFDTFINSFLGDAPTI